MKFSLLLLLVWILYLLNGSTSPNAFHLFPILIDTVQFRLVRKDSNYFLNDLKNHKTLFVADSLLFEAAIEEDDIAVEKTLFEEKTNSFLIDNQLIGLQLSSYQIEGRYAEGKDIFLIYDSQN